MPHINELDLKTMLKDVSIVESSFKVVFPWGFKIVEFKGEKVLQPLTPEEYRAAAMEEPGKKLTPLDMAGRHRCPCKLTNTGTVTPACSEAGGGWCSFHCSEGRCYSICNYL